MEAELEKDVENEQTQQMEVERPEEVQIDQKKDRVKPFKRRCLVKEQQDMEASLPLKAKMTQKKFEKGYYKRAKEFEQKKELHLENLKEASKIKEDQNTPHYPLTNRNVEVEGDFYTRMLKDDIKRNLKQLNTDASIMLDEELTFSPRLNVKSLSMQRSYNDIMVWNDKKQLKLDIMRDEKENISYNFYPSVKSGHLTRSKYREDIGVPKRKVTEEQEPTSEELRFLRNEMVPMISKTSRDLTKNRNKFSYMSGTYSRAATKSIEKSLKKNNKRKADKIPLDVVELFDRENPQNVKTNESEILASERIQSKSLNNRKKRPKSVIVKKRSSVMINGTNIPKLNMKTDLENPNSPSYMAMELTSKESKKKIKKTKKKKGRFTKVYDTNPKFNYERAMNLNPQDEYNKNFISNTFCRCHGYATYERKVKHVPQEKPEERPELVYIIQKPYINENLETHNFAKRTISSEMSTEEDIEPITDQNTLKSPQWHYVPNVNKLEAEYGDKFRSLKPNVITFRSRENSEQSPEKTFINNSIPNNTFINNNFVDSAMDKRNMKVNEDSQIYNNSAFRNMDRINYDKAQMEEVLTTSRVNNLFNKEHNVRPNRQKRNERSRNYGKYVNSVQGDPLGERDNTHLDFNEQENIWKMSEINKNYENQSVLTKNQDLTMVQNLEVFCNKYLDSSLVSYKKGPLINDVSNIYTNKNQARSKNKTKSHAQTKDNSFLLKNNLAGNQTPIPKRNDMFSKKNSNDLYISNSRSPMKSNLLEVPHSRTRGNGKENLPRNYRQVPRQTLKSRDNSRLYESELIQEQFEDKSGNGTERLVTDFDPNNC